MPRASFDRICRDQGSDAGLARIGRNDLAYQLLHNKTFILGFYHSKQALRLFGNGGTAGREEGFADPGMNSFAHYSFGAVGQWMIENIGGINTDGPAFKKILIRPQPGGHLTWAKTTYHSIRGPITSNWKIDRGRLILDVAIPPNTTAVVYVPAETRRSGSDRTQRKRRRIYFA